MVELGIVDIREIVRLIKKVHNYDFSNFALTSLKYRLEKLIAKNNLLSTESLFHKLSEGQDFFDSFLNDLFVPSTEMLRDPSLWRWLREDYFQKLPSKKLDNFKIWIPHCISGAELYSMCILLKEINLLKKVRIIASSYSQKSIDYIKSGKYPLKKLEVSIENYKRFNGEYSFNNYYEIINNEAIRDRSLISNVEFIKDDITFNKAPGNVKLILFRNVMIYYNPSEKNKILERLSNTMSASGHLIIGTKETINLSNTPDISFELINDNESIYKRSF